MPCPLAPASGEGPGRGGAVSTATQAISTRQRPARTVSGPSPQRVPVSEPPQWPAILPAARPFVSSIGKTSNPRSSHIHNPPGLPLSLQTRATCRNIIDLGRLVTKLILLSMYFSTVATLMAKNQIHWSRLYLWLRARKLEGTYPGGGPQTGAWPTSVCRVQRGWGRLEEKHWPYIGDPQNWPFKEPEGVDRLAKEFRVFRYYRIRSASEVRIALASGVGSINAAFRVVAEDWYHAQNGQILLPSKKALPNAGHCVAILPFRQTGPDLMFMNSWGAKWGDKGWGYMAQEFFDQYMTDAWFVEAPFAKAEAPETQHGIQPTDWGHLDALGRRNFGMELIDCDKDERVGWWFGVDTGETFEIEEFFVMPKYRRQGQGSTMMKDLLQSAKTFHRSIVMWIPHPDWNDNQRPCTERFLRRFGFVVTSSSNPWAAARAAMEDVLDSNTAFQSPFLPMAFHVFCGENKN